MCPLMFAFSCPLAVGCCSSAAWRFTVVYYTNGSIANTVPPAKMTAESAKRGLFTPSWHDSESSIPTMPTSMTMPDMTKYDVEPNHRQASMNSRMSRYQMEMSIQSRALLLFMVHRF